LSIFICGGYYFVRYLEKDIIYGNGGFLQKIIFLTVISVSFLILGCASPRYDYLSKAENKQVTHKTKETDIKNKNTESNKDMRGEASWYGPGYHGKTTANGEKFNQNDMTAAHKTLPFNTKVKVTDLETKKSVVVRINDRGPYAKERIIDLSQRAAEKLGMKEKGHALVSLEIVK
jgi:rare lipoprotein A